MAKLSYTEWLEQKKETGTTATKTAAPSSTSANTGVSGSSYNSGTTSKLSYSDWLSERKKKESSESINGWLNQTSQTLNNVNSYLGTWRSENDPQYEVYREQISGQLAQADIWRKQYAGNEEALAIINKSVKYLSDAMQSMGQRRKYYSNWNNNQDYQTAVNRWNNFSTAENRQAWYQQSQTKLQALQEQRRQIIQEQSTYKPGGNPYTSGGSAATTGMPYGAARQTSSDPRLAKIDEEIAQIQTEMKMYERGNTDENGFYYGFKTADDYGKLRQNADFGAMSANRNFANPTREELDAYDATQSAGSEALNNGGYFDEKGNIRNAKGEIVQYASGHMVKDKLGLYMAATEQDITEAYNILPSSMGNYLPTWANFIQEGETNNWKYLKEEEVETYYYLLNTKGQETAYQFLDDMQVELGRRATIETNKAIDGASGWEKAGLNVLSVGMNLIGGIPAIIDDAGSLLRGEEINPYSRAHYLINTGNYIRQSTAADINEATGNKKLPLLDFSWGDAYQAGMSAVDSFVGAKLGGKAYQALMSMGAASTTAKQIYEQGGNTNQIVMSAVSAGAAEWFFEKYSIENLLTMKSPETLWQFVKNGLIQGGIELSEEAATELANIITNGLIMQSQSDWEKLLRENGGDYGAAFREMAIRVANAGLGGFLSGGVSGGIQQGAAYAAQQQKNVATGQYINQSKSTDSLLALAQEMAGTATGSAQKKLNAQSERLGKDFITERGKNKATGRLYNTVQSVVTEQNISEISAALQEKGFSKKDATAIAGAVALQANGIELSEKQQKVLEKFSDNADVKNVLNELLDNKDSGINQRARSVTKFEFGALRNHMVSQMEQAASEQKKTGAEGNLPGAKEMASYEVSEDGKTRLISEPDTEVSVKGFASTKNGKAMLTLSDGSTVAAEDVSFGDSGEALVYATIADMGVSVDTANALVEAFDPENGITAPMYALDIQEAYKFGGYNYPMKAVENDPYASVKKQAWNEGRIEAIKSSKDDQSNVDATFQKAEKVLQQSGKKVSGEYGATLEKGIIATSLNESQRASYRLADQIAQAAKVNIRVYDGKTGEWGYYDPKNDQIYLNLNATNKSKKSMMAFALGHELVHRAKKGSPAKYQAFADFLMQEYGKKGISLEDMIGEQIDAAREHGIDMTRDEAFEEVVCESCQRMLLDTDAGKKLAEFGAQSKQNKSFLEDLKRWITEFMEKLRSIFAGVDPDSIPAREFAKFDEGVKQILADMFVGMTIDAGEHLSVIQSAFGKDTNVLTNDQGEFTMAQNADGSEKLFNLVTWENGGRETLEATLLREGYTEEEVNAALTIMDGKQALVKSIATEMNDSGKLAFPEQGRINEAVLTTDIKDGHAVLSALVSNGDYPVNIDLLMVCKKRKAYQRVINRLCETGMIQQATVDALAIAEINKILGKYGFETACLGCFVESRRLRIQEWAQTIVKEWNSEVKKRNPNAKAFGFGKGEATLTSDEVMQLIGELESGGKKNEQGNLNLGQGSAVKRMGVLLDKVPSLRRTLTVEDLITPDGLTALRKFDSNLFSMVKSRYGSNSPKFVQEFNPYNHELAKYGTVPTEYESLRDYLYSIGGARMQSFSDFIVENWFDYCQIVADLAARKLPMHTYTKEIALARLFGMTGIKINMSLIPDIDRSLGKEYAGLTRNAKGELELIWADKDRYKATGGKSYMQSINFADAIALQEDPNYSANVGTIAVGISDMHIRMMLADPRIRMVIPYHSSGMNPIFADLMGTSYYKDYTNFQNTTVKQIYNSKGQPVSLKLDKTQTGKLTGGFLFNSVLQELGDARAAADAYKEWCSDASLHTITIMGETYTAELTPKFNDFAKEDNYYKLLEDFNTYDCISEQAAPQGDVKQIYPEGFEKILRDELTGQEKYRQKQEKNNAFDKAMGEIETYLKNHSKADTVHYANQHGIKLGAKDKKLSAADKAKLKQLQDDGVKRKLPVSEQKKITRSMTDSERTEILKDKVITAEVYEGQADKIIEENKDSLNSNRDKLIKAALVKIGEEFKVFTDYRISDVNLDIRLSKGNIKESVSKKINPTQIAKLLPVFRSAVENSVGVECHANRYYYDNDTVMFENLLGGYVDGNYFVPIRIGLKHSKNGGVTLYLIVDQNKIEMKKIKAEVSKVPVTRDVQSETSHSAFDISLASIIRFVNSKDLLRYLPDDLLNDNQRKAKWEAIAETIIYTKNKNDTHYSDFIKSGNIFAAKLMVQKAANVNGYTINAYHQTGSVFTEFSTDNPVAGKNDSETPNGIFFKTNDHDIGLGGGIQMEVYLNIQNMLHFKNREEANAWYCDNVPGYKELQDQMNSEIKVINDEIESMEEEYWSEDTSEERYEELDAIEENLIAKMKVIEDDYRGRLRELLDDYFLTGKSGYDGIELDYDGHRWVNGKREDVHTYIAFNPEQAKSADAITYDDNGAIIPISQRFDSEKKDIRYKLPVGEDTSPRALLANAFEGVVQDDIERRNLKQYQEKVDMLNAEEAKLEELRSEIYELSFAKGKRDTQRIRELKFEAMHTENRINTLDKTLLRFEASAPLQKILKREKEMVRKRERERVKAASEVYRKKSIETMEKREARLKLQKLVLDTAKWISYPKKDEVKCPDLLKKPYADFLNGIDLSSKRLAEGGDPTKNDLRMANAMSSLATALERITMSQDPNQETTTVLDTGYLDLPAGFVQKLKDMTEKIKAMMVDGDFVVNNMSAAEVRQLSQMIRTLNKAIREMSTLYANLRFSNVEELGDSTMQFMDDLGEIAKTNGVMDFVEWENALPYYAFKRFGIGGESIFEGLMDAQDKLSYLSQQIFDFRDKTWNGKEAKAWSEDTHTIDLPGEGKLTLTTADAMTIYCLSRRKQGLQHLLGGGVRVVGIQKGSKKAKDSRSILSIEDIEAINSSLTDRQRAVAEAIQEFMSTVCSDWGNEISMKRFLTREFTEKNYFPIESNDENLPTKDPAAQQSDLFRLLNISATKPIDPKANNEVIVRNIFDVFTGHASDMARLNAFGMPLLDYMKWLNYREKAVNEEGQIKVTGVRKSMERAYGNAAKSYVLNLIKDVNGRASDGGDPTFLMKWMRTAKTASVGNSLRVATLQMTSYPRAALVLSPKSLALGLSKMPNIERAMEYCGIALWKSFGFYDTNIARSIEDQMKGVTDVKQKLIELSLKGAELGDAITWGALWNACEYEVAATKQYEIGSEEFNQAVGKKLREVVYATQVVDSTLTRSQIMRSKRGMAQEASAFMSEPTLSANILMDAWFQFHADKRRTGSAKTAWKNTGKYVGRALAVYAIGQITAALLEGLWDAWRDDEDEEFKEKYVDAFLENLLLDLLPFNKIPIISDVAEAALAMFDVGFYSSDKMSTTWLTQAVSAVDAWKDVLGGKSSATVYNALYKSMRAVSSYFGVSISGVMREGVALWNNTAGVYDSTLKIRNYEPSKSDKASALLDAIIEGNDRQAQSLRAEFEDEDAIKSAMRTAIKNRFVSGEIDKMTSLRYLVLYGGVDAGDAIWYVEKWEFDKQNDSGEDYKKYAEFHEAVRTGKNLKEVIKKYTENGVKMTELRSQITSHFKPEYLDMSASDRASIKGYIINAMVACGIERDDAEYDLKEWDFEAENDFAYADRKTAYLNGEITREQLRNALIKFGGYEPEDADTQIQVYDWNKQGYENATMNNVRKYNEFCKPAGVPIDTYLQIVDFANDTENDVDPETGKTINYSAVRKIMAEINSYPLTNDQKTAIALSLWKESTVKKCKLW